MGFVGTDSSARTSIYDTLVSTKECPTRRDHLELKTPLEMVVTAPMEHPAETAEVLFISAFCPE